MTIFSAALLLFLVIDPFGNIPFFITALSAVDKSRHNFIIVRELLIALAVLLLFLFSGEHILKALHISEPALTVSGGILLFLIAVKMIFPSNKRVAEDLTGEPFIFPLAVPYMAGPSAMASILFIMNKEPARWADWLIALLIAWFFSGLIILMSGFLAKFFGKKALLATKRLMGMLLVVISVQMLMSGISDFILSI
ncbi:MAG: MarC family protein [Deltaproteobacteria bacterium]|nr:MarC family protein [Deltaproteobacteria bacterium]